MKNTGYLLYNNSNESALRFGTALIFILCALFQFRANAQCTFEVPTTVVFPQNQFSVIMKGTGCPPAEFELSIYNRWGQLVFETSDPYAYWDGNDKNQHVPDGVYFYTLKSDNESLTGNVTFIVKDTGSQSNPNSEVPSEAPGKTSAVKKEIRSKKR
jgi:gliding motility-associated-like protein